MDILVILQLIELSGSSSARCHSFYFAWCHISEDWYFHIHCYWNVKLQILKTCHCNSCCHTCWVSNLKWMYQIQLEWVVVSTVTGSWAGQSRIWFVAGIKHLSLLECVQIVPPSLFFSRYRSSFLGEKWPGCKVDHSPPCSRKGEEWVEEYFCCWLPSWHAQGQLYVCIYTVLLL